MNPPLQLMVSLPWLKWAQGDCLGSADVGWDGWYPKFSLSRGSHVRAATAAGEMLPFVMVLLSRMVFARRWWQWQEAVLPSPVPGGTLSSQLVWIEYPEWCSSKQTALCSAVDRAALCRTGVRPPHGPVMGAIPICPMVMWEPQYNPPLHHRLSSLVAFPMD